MDLATAFLERCSVKKCLSSSCAWKGRYQEGAWLVVTAADKSLDSQERNRDMEGNTPGLWRFTKTWKHQMELGSRKTGYKNPLSKSVSFYYLRMGWTRREDVTFPSNESRGWRKALLKPIRRGRNTKIPSSAPQAASRRSVPRSNAFLVIQRSRRTPESVPKGAQSRHCRCVLPDPEHFTTISNTLWKQPLITMGKRFQQGKAKTPIVSLLLSGLPKQTFTSAHFIARMQFPFLSPLVACT